MVVTREGRHRRVGASDDRTVGVDELDADGRARRDAGLVSHVDRDHDDGTGVVDLGRAYLEPIRGEVDTPRPEEPHVPVEAGARVPAGVVSCFHLDAEHVLRVVSQQVVDRHEEVRVAVRAVRGDGAVHGDHRVAVHALELQHDGVGVGAGVVARDIQGAPVLPAPAGEVARSPGPRSECVARRSSRRAAT